MWGIWVHCQNNECPIIREVYRSPESIQRYECIKKLKTSINAGDSNQGSNRGISSLQSEETTPLHWWITVRCCLAILARTLIRYQHRITHFYKGLWELIFRICVYNIRYGCLWCTFYVQIFLNTLKWYIECMILSCRKGVHMWKGCGNSKLLKQ